VGGGGVGGNVMYECTVSLSVTQCHSVASVQHTVYQCHLVYSVPLSLSVPVYHFTVSLGVPQSHTRAHTHTHTPIHKQWPVASVTQCTVSLSVQCHSVASVQHIVYQCHLVYSVT